MESDFNLSFALHLFTYDQRIEILFWKDVFFTNHLLKYVHDS